MFGSKDVEPHEAFDKAFGGEVPGNGMFHFDDNSEGGQEEGTGPRFTDRGPQRGKANETLRALSERYKFNARMVDEGRLSADDRDVQRIAASFRHYRAHFVESAGDGRKGGFHSRACCSRCRAESDVHPPRPGWPMHA